MAVVHFTNERHFNATTGEVVAGGRRIRLEPQPAALLALLASRPGDLVTHDEICRQLWSDGRHVDYAAGLHYAVRQIRRALGGDGRDIETLPRRGYRLRAEALGGAVAFVVSAESKTLGAAAAGRRRAVAAWLLAFAASCALVAFVEQRPNNHHALAVTLLQAVHDALY